MAGGDQPFYWDTCLFIAWLKDEKRKLSSEMDGVREYIERLKRREIKIITSTLTITETTEAKVEADVLNIFDDLMKRRNLSKVAVDMRVARLARDLRDYYSQRPDEFNKKTLSVPDSIHLAIAILYRAQEFNTFDRHNRSGTLGLLPLNGDVAGHRLTSASRSLTNRAWTYDGQETGIDNGSVAAG